MLSNISCKNSKCYFNTKDRFCSYDEAKLDENGVCTTMVVDNSDSTAATHSAAKPESRC